MPPGTSSDWQPAAQRYLERLASAEYSEQKKRSKGKKSFRYSPSEYQRDLVEKLGKNDEEGFKVQKMLQGYASVLKV